MICIGHNRLAKLVVTSDSTATILCNLSQVGTKLLQVRGQKVMDFYFMASTITKLASRLSLIRYSWQKTVLVPCLVSWILLLFFALFMKGQTNHRSVIYMVVIIKRGSSFFHTRIKKKKMVFFREKIETSHTTTHLFVFLLHKLHTYRVFNNRH